MKAVTIVSFGGVEGLEIREVADAPPATLDRVRVRVRAAGLNRADILQRLGRYPAPPGYPQDIPGIEFAGEVLKSAMKCAGGKLAIACSESSAAAGRRNT